VFASRSIDVARFDDGLTLDSFARSLSSVNKAYLDGCNFFGEQFGTRGPMSRGEFEFKRTTQSERSRLTLSVGSPRFARRGRRRA
jgi:hypothetical protein